MKTLIPSIIVLIIGITVAYVMISKPKPLKIFNPADINPKLVDESLQGTTKNHRVGDFNLTDQDGNTVTPKDFDDKIYVADFFFVTCPTICPKMTDQMLRVYKELEDNNQLLFLSHTVMPEEDSVPVLKEYADKFNISSERWKLVTGDKKHIYNLARKTYFAAVTEGDGGKDDFIHTENFVLVDKDKRLRGFYDGTSEKDVDRLIKDISTLMLEYEK